MNREIYFMEDRFIEDEIESAIKKYWWRNIYAIKKLLIMEFNQFQEIWTPRNMIK